MATEADGRTLPGEALPAAQREKPRSRRSPAAWMMPRVPIGGRPADRWCSSPTARWRCRRSRN